MKKLLCIAIAALLAMAAAGCNRQHKTDPGAVTPGPNSNPIAELPTEPLPEIPEESSEPPASPDPQEADEMAQRIEGLIKDEYDGIEMTAAVLPRNAILPGSTIPLTVTVQNTGDKSVFYIHGSGSFHTPTALGLRVPGLQPIAPQDQLGPATLDLVTNELKPGEKLSFIMMIRAVEPHPSFNDWTHQLFFDKNQYIGELSWEELEALHPELRTAKPGSYEAQAYFLYTLPQEGEESGMFQLGEPSGYAEAIYTIGVTG